jgi:hypothetical protein
MTSDMKRSAAFSRRAIPEVVLISGHNRYAHTSREQSSQSSKAKADMGKSPARGVHHVVKFASRYAGSPFKTLTAAAARWRAEELANDARALIELRAAAEERGIRFGNRADAYEIVSYYAVGLVTCLEWHARSRLVDLMMFQPSSIEANDVKNVGNVAISQMVSEGATIPHLLGGATKVSQLNEYLKIFSRIFKALDIEADIEKELRSTPAAIDTHRMDDDTSLFGALDRLFVTRNHLVHEIDQGIIGHFSVRDMWSPHEALQHAQAVTAAIKSIELHITKEASTEFPNRLLEDGTEEDELEKLNAAVSELESDLTRSIEKFEDNEAIWKEALAAIQYARSKEMAYVDEAVFLRPVRHLDMRRSTQIELLKNRLAFLRLLKSELELTMG